MKFLSLFIVLLMSQYSFASSGSVCDQAEMRLVGGTNFYKSFLVSSRDLKQAYTAFYQKVDDRVETFLKGNCPNRNVSQVNSAYQTSCYNACTIEAPLFHDLIDTRYRKRSKIKTLIKECKSVCDTQFNCEQDVLCNAGL